MSVITTFDQKGEELKDKLKEAIEILDIMLDEDTWGHDQVTSTYIDDLDDIRSIIRIIKRKL